MKEKFEANQNNEKISQNNEEIRSLELDDDNEIEEQEKTPGQIKKILNNIRNKFRNSFKVSNDNDLLKQKLNEEIQYASQEAIREGVDFSMCQMDEVMSDYNSGKKVEFESFSPYLQDYNMTTGEIWGDNLTATDEAGIEIAKTLSRLLPKARLISLYDEYNTDISTAQDAYGGASEYQRDEMGRIIKDDKGNPLKAPQMELSDDVKKRFKQDVERVLREKGVLSDDDKEGEKYLFISESEKIIDAEELVKQLEDNGNIKRNGQEIIFINHDAENPSHQEITLRTSNGRWLCEALDASSYIKPENLEITHLVILPREFKEQQDKVWEILRVLGIDSTHYHNIFFDNKGNPQKIAELIQEEIEKYKNNK